MCQFIGEVEDDPQRVDESVMLQQVRVLMEARQEVIRAEKEKRPEIFSIPGLSG